MEFLWCVYHALLEMRRRIGIPTRVLLKCQKSNPTSDRMASSTLCRESCPKTFYCKSLPEILYCKSRLQTLYRESCAKRSYCKNRP